MTSFAWWEAGRSLHKSPYSHSVILRVISRLQCFSAVLEIINSCTILTRGCCSGWVGCWRPNTWQDDQRAAGWWFCRLKEQCVAQTRHQTTFNAASQTITGLSLHQLSPKWHLVLYSSHHWPACQQIHYSWARVSPPALILILNAFLKCLLNPITRAEVVLWTVWH